MSDQDLHLDLLVPCLRLGQRVLRMPRIGSFDLASRLEGLLEAPPYDEDSVTVYPIRLTEGTTISIDTPLGEISLSAQQRRLNLSYPIPWQPLIEPFLTSTPTRDGSTYRVTIEPDDIAKLKLPVQGFKAALELRNRTLT